MEPQKPKIPAEAIELWRYNKAAADQAWWRTIEWFNQYVRG